MSPIRPVVTSFPSSAELWDESNLPFACVLTPLDASEGSLISSNPPLLTGIAKCLHCGAPHPNKHSHYRPAGSMDGVLLCYLCGRLSSTDRNEQQQARAPQEGALMTTDADRSSSSRQASQSQDQNSTYSINFALPLRLQPHQQQQPTHVNVPLYSTPASFAPLLWFLVLDGSSTNRNYWQSISHLLLQVVRDMPSHVHVSLLLASTIQTCDLDGTVVDEDSTLAIYQLASPVPHVLQYSSSSSDENDLIQAVLSSLVPADGAHRSHLLTALRSLIDYTPQITDSSATQNCFPLEWTTQLILEALESYCQPAGQRRNGESLLPYAGGSILMLPASTLVSNVRRRHGSAIGMGGFGGRTCSEPGQRFGGPGSLSSDENPVTTVAASSDLESGMPPHDNGIDSRQEESELTADNLTKRYRAPDDIYLEFAELGSQSARAAVGVDLLLIADSSDPDDSLPDFGLPLVSCLVDQSGAPGPLLFDLHDTESASRLEREMIARTPWHDQRVYGAELRLRLSPGYTVETSSIERLTDQQGPQLAPLYVNAGLMGPATAVDESRNLWRMGTCDPFTSLTVDLSIQQNALPDRSVVEGLGALKPVMQTCFAYTTLIKTEDGLYQTVRQMRITSFPIPLARSVEALYSSLDPEALAVVLFHKLALAAYQDGLTEMNSIAEKWLQSLLVCAYKSAEVQEKVQREQEAKGINGSSTFVPNERLLDREGELAAEDVLLAQGHDRLRTVPLMIYLLLQCDALRPSRGAYRPSIDLRYAALSQMASMTPINLTRCIAPRIQLWSSGHEEDNTPILGILDLRRDAVQLAVMEYSETTDLILFIDSPHQFFVMDGRYVNASATSASLPQLDVGAGLKQTITEAGQSYRTQPSVVYELNQASTNGERTFLHLLDALIADAPSASGHENFYEWRSDIALSVHEELEKQ